MRRATERYRVERIGGRDLDRWRVIFKSHDRRVAEARYDREVAATRKGGVRLRDAGPLPSEILQSEVVRRCDLFWKDP